MDRFLFLLTGAFGALRGTRPALPHHPLHDGAIVVLPDEHAFVAWRREAERDVSAHSRGIRSRSTWRRAAAIHLVQALPVDDVHRMPRPSS